MNLPAIVAYLFDRARNNGHRGKVKVSEFYNVLNDAKRVFPEASYSFLLWLGQGLRLFPKETEIKAYWFTAKPRDLDQRKSWLGPEANLMI